MTHDRRALIAAIIADPDDDAPRLVYSDWLEENDGYVTCKSCSGSGFRLPSINDAPKYEYQRGSDGRTYVFPIHKPLSAMWPKCTDCNGEGEVANGFKERAEFCRVQIKLAREYPEECAGKSDYLLRSANGIYAALRRRERELRKSNEVLWLDGWSLERGMVIFGDFGGERIADEINSGRTNWQWRRGFIDSITCTAADWIAHANAILAEHPVREVTLTTGFSVWTDTAGVTWICCLGNNRRTDLPTSSIRTNAETLAEEWPGITFHLPPQENEEIYSNIGGLSTSILRGRDLLIRLDDKKGRSP